MTDSLRFELLVDHRQSPESSLIRRYLRGCGLELGAAEAERFQEYLGAASIEEGVRIVPLLVHRGVRVDVLDETSRMHTRTFKSLDGCVTAAHCMRNGYDRVVLESGGNAGTAIAAYCRKLGIETYCFVPERNLPLLNSQVFSSATNHLIAVQEDGMVKAASRRFAQKHGLPMVPSVEWRFEAGMLRGQFILEQLLAGRRIDWLAQTISAAFGPIGIYRGLRRHGRGLPAMPRFLAVQQATNCPMFEQWRRGLDVGGRGGRIDGQLLVSVMYDTAPQTHGTYPELADLVQDTRGSMTTVSRDELDSFLDRRFDDGTVIELLARQDIRFGERSGEVSEKAGLLALAGLLKQIDCGDIAEGSVALVSLTGGAADNCGGVACGQRITSIEQVDQIPLTGMPC